MEHHEKFLHWLINVCSGKLSEEEMAIGITAGLDTTREVSEQEMVIGNMCGLNTTRK